MKQLLLFPTKKEKLEMGIEIDPLNRWNGNWKTLTKDCDGCSSHYIIKQRDICTKGIAWKYLVNPVRRLRKCQYLK